MLEEFALKEIGFDEEEWRQIYIEEIWTVKRKDKDNEMTKPLKDTKQSITWLFFTEKEISRLRSSVEDIIFF